MALVALVVLAALKGDRTLADLAKQFDVHPHQIADWKTQRMERLAQVFGDNPVQEAESESPTRGPPDLPVPPAQSDDQSSEPGLGDLPLPEILQQEIIDHLEAALASFREVAVGLQRA